MISFDGANTQQERWQTKRFAAFRESSTVGEFNKCCAHNMSPDGYIAIYETLYPARDGISYHSRHTGKINQLSMV